MLYAYYVRVVIAVEGKSYLDDEGSLGVVRLY